MIYWEHFDAIYFISLPTCGLRLREERTNRCNVNIYYNIHNIHKDMGNVHYAFFVAHYALPRYGDSP